MKKIMIGFLLIVVLLSSACTQASPTPSADSSPQPVLEYVKLRNKDGEQFRLNITDAADRDLFVVQLTKKQVCIHELERYLNLTSYTQRECQDQALKEVPPTDTPESTFCLYLTHEEREALEDMGYDVRYVLHKYSFYRLDDRAMCYYDIDEYFTPGGWHNNNSL